MSNRCQATNWFDNFCLTWQKKISKEYLTGSRDILTKFKIVKPMSCQTDVKPPIGLTFSAWHDRKRYQRNIWQDLEIIWLSSKLSNRCHVKPPSIDWGLCLKFPMKSWIIEIFLGVIWMGDDSLGSPLKLESWKHFFGEYSFSSPRNMNRSC